jgi:hypothetical protein
VHTITLVLTNISLEYNLTLSLFFYLSPYDKFHGYVIMIML